MIENREIYLTSSFKIFKTEKRVFCILVVTNKLFCVQIVFVLLIISDYALNNAFLTTIVEILLVSLKRSHFVCIIVVHSLEWQGLYLVGFGLPEKNMVY